MKPGKSFFILAGILFCLGFAAFFFEPLIFIWFMLAIISGIIILLDAIFFRFMDKLESKRTINASLALGNPEKVCISLRRTEKFYLPTKIKIFDLYPDSMTCTIFPVEINSKGFERDGTLQFEYTIIPSQRGEWEFTGLELLCSSPLFFWEKKIIHNTKSSGRTYPDFKKILGLSAKELRGITEQAGMKSIRKRGLGLEFQSLREYQFGDSIKSIDWRASARRQKPIVKEYQEEQDQQVLFLLDTGYRLHRKENEYYQFDNALNAVLLLSYIALKHDDSVVIGTFGGEERWLPPQKGLSALPCLMNQLYDLHSSPAASSPFSALENALKRLHKRTFIILISNFRKEDGESLSWILPRIQKKHLLLLVSLRELEAEKLQMQSSPTTETLLEKTAAFSYLYNRNKLYKQWEHSGLLTLETAAEKLSSSLINTYLDVKRSGKL
jgi:uncharacterized protein (DUF58 family)